MLVEGRGLRQHGGVSHLEGPSHAQPDARLEGIGRLSVHLQVQRIGAALRETSYPGLGVIEGDCRGQNKARKARSYPVSPETLS